MKGLKKIILKKTAAVASAIRSKRQDVKIKRVVMEDCFASNSFFYKETEQEY